MFKINKNNFFRIWKTSLQKSIKFKRLNFLFSFDSLFGYESSQTVFYKFVKEEKLESISNFGLIFFVLKKFLFFFMFSLFLYFAFVGIQKKKQRKRSSKKFKSEKKKITG
jgi:hypothetical protein